MAQGDILRGFQALARSRQAKQEMALRLALDERDRKEADERRTESLKLTASQLGIDTTGATTREEIFELMDEKAREVKITKQFQDSAGQPGLASTVQGTFRAGTPEQQGTALQRAIVAMAGDEVSPATRSSLERVLANAVQSGQVERQEAEQVEERQEARDRRSAALQLETFRKKELSERAGDVGLPQDSPEDVILRAEIAAAAGTPFSDGELTKLSQIHNEIDQVEKRWGGKGKERGTFKLSDAFADTRALVDRTINTAPKRGGMLAALPVPFEVEDPTFGAPRFQFRLAGPALAKQGIGLLALRAQDDDDAKKLFDFYTSQPEVVRILQADFSDPASQEELAKEGGQPAQEPTTAADQAPTRAQQARARAIRDLQELGSGASRVGSAISSGASRFAEFAGSDIPNTLRGLLGRDR